MQLREQYDADRFGGQERASTFQTADNAFPAICEMCGGTWYVSQDWSDAINSAVEKGLENPFLCDNCKAEYEEMGGRRIEAA
jgi:hypothetical protein